MNLDVAKVRRLQERVGVPADGAFGPKTLDATLRALGIAEGPGLAAGSSGTAAASDHAPAGGLRTSDGGVALIHSFEQCRLTAYPDPGSSNGEPWTIGWGSTGPDIRRGTVWTQAQADDRFRRDLARFERGVAEAIGAAATSQSQFDAMVCLAYNIGLRAFAGSTVARKHKAGDHAGAAAAFGMWVKNDGQVMRGLVRRRAAEAALYGGQR